MASGRRAAARAGRGVVPGPARKEAGAGDVDRSAARAEQRGRGKVETVDGGGVGADLAARYARWVAPFSTASRAKVCLPMMVSLPPVTSTVFPS